MKNIFLILIIVFFVYVSALNTQDDNNKSLFHIKIIKCNETSKIPRVFLNIKNKK